MNDDEKEDLLRRITELEKDNKVLKEEFKELMWSLTYGQLRAEILKEAADNLHDWARRGNSYSR